MNAPAENNFEQMTNTRLDKLEHALSAGLQSLRSEMHAGFSRMEAQAVSGREFEVAFQALREEINARFAQLESQLAKSQLELIKWIIATLLTVATIGVSIVAALLITPTRNAAPTIIYAQPPAYVAPAPQASPASPPIAPR